MICGMTMYQIFWYFIIYSLIGWMIEVVFHAVTQGKIVNRIDVHPYLLFLFPEFHQRICIYGVAFLPSVSIRIGIPSVGTLTFTDLEHVAFFVFFFFLLPSFHLT